MNNKILQKSRTVKIKQNRIFHTNHFYLHTTNHDTILCMKGDGGVKCNNNKDKGLTTITLKESEEHGSTSVEEGQSGKICTHHALPNIIIIIVH